MTDIVVRPVDPGTRGTTSRRQARAVLRADMPPAWAVTTPADARRAQSCPGGGEADAKGVCDRDAPARFDRLARGKGFGDLLLFRRHNECAATSYA